MEAGLGIISESEVREALTPLEPDLVACVEEAVKAWREKGVPLVAAPRGRFRSNFIAGVIEHQVRMRFGGLPGVTVVDEGQRMLVNVQDRFLLQFKKVNTDHLPSNYQTRTAMKFAAQEPLPGFGRLPRITVGHRLDRLNTELLEVMVIFALGKRVHWKYPLTGKGHVIQIPLFRIQPPAQQSTQSTQPAQRVRIKVQKADDSESGTT